MNHATGSQLCEKLNLEISTCITIYLSAATSSHYL